MDLRRVFLAYLEAPNSIFVKNRKIGRIILKFQNFPYSPCLESCAGVIHGVSETLLTSANAASAAEINGSSTDHLAGVTRSSTGQPGINRSSGYQRERQDPLMEGVPLHRESHSEACLSLIDISRCSRFKLLSVENLAGLCGGCLAYLTLACRRFSIHDF